MSTTALRLITTTAAAAAAILLPVVDPRASRPPAPMVASTGPDASSHRQLTASAVPCVGMAWRLDPAGRHWPRTAPWPAWEERAAQRLLERARRLEHDPLS
jgi:hypothetical protein